MNCRKEVFAPADFRNLRTCWVCLIALALVACGALPAFAAGKLVAHNTPGYVASAKSLGAVDPSRTMEVSIWLQPHNRAQLDALADQLYDRNSPNYRHWLKHSEFVAQFAPTAKEAKTVQQFFQAHNLKVVKVGPDNFFVRARGTAGDVERAFRVQLNNYKVGNKTIRANAGDPFVEGAAAPLVRAISGLDSGKYEHPLLIRQTSLPSGQANAAAVKAHAVHASSGDWFTTNCFDGVVTRTLSTNDDGEFPIGTFKGNHYFETPTSAGCGYTPPELQKAYNLSGLYASGFDGTGQTIAIIDWCGSLTIQDDANAFSTMFGLPQLTSSNFSIIQYPRKSTCGGPNLEINLDVEWAHAIAPGANINLIVPPSNFFQDIDQAEYFTISSGMGNVISGSYGAPEAFVASSELDNGNLLSEIAAVMGISTNFSSGDCGDFSACTGLNTVSYPADAPFATAIGGVTLALNADNTIKWQSGWGNNETLLTEEGFIFDPPLTFGFDGGAGGGPSTCEVQDSNFNCLAGFPKPKYQKKLPGKYRQLPDISWLADPFTGPVVLISEAGQFPPQVWFAVGGTSASCPMFSGLWAIANQEAGAPLGQAAPYVYSLPAGAVMDVVPVSVGHNVTASIQESTSLTNTYTAAEVGGVASGKFISAIWDYPFIQDTEVVLTFGTDSSLKTKTGWDNVTGVGTPNGQAFAEAFKSQ